MKEKSQERGKNVKEKKTFFQFGTNSFFSTFSYDQYNVWLYSIYQRQIRILYFFPNFECRTKKNR